MCITDVCHATQTLVFQTAQFVGTTPLVNGFQSSAASRRAAFFHHTYLPVVWTT